jgi:hypothetical protein
MIFSLNVLILEMPLISLLRVQNEILLFVWISVWGSFLEATNIVVTTSALSNHYPLPDMTT